MQPSGIISLTTDFGLTDPYVGQMKGAVLRRNPAVQLVDLSHAIARQDVIGAAIVLHSSYAFFPAATVHLVVVDPGVGGERRILAAEGDGHCFIAPDNGIFSLLLRDRIINRVYLVEQRELFAGTVSSTFHGRDIMGPVAAALAGGSALAEVGTEIPPASCIRLNLPVARISEKSIQGEVLQIDHFGNIRTTIRRTDVQHVEELHHPHQWRVRIRGYEIAGLRIAYSEVVPGELLALFDSVGYLEVAVNRGSAAELTQCRVGDPVRVDFLP